jgi:peptide/nickel transport system permease protein
MTRPLTVRDTTRPPSAAGRLWRRAPVSIWIAAAVIVIYVLAALFAPLIAPFGEAQVVTEQPFAPWDGSFLLGTDQLGRDVFSRLIYGARNTIGIAVLTTTLAFLIGVSSGLGAALKGGWVDQVLARATDVVMAIPYLIFTLVLLAVLGASVVNLVLIIALLDATRVFRLTRAAAMEVVVADFIEVARLRGERTLWIGLHEVLPNIVSTLAVEYGLRFCFVFLTIASLSFLGVGLQPPTAEWGSMVRDTAVLIGFGVLTPLVPAIAIASLTVAINLLVDWWLQERLEQRAGA